MINKKNIVIAAVLTALMTGFTIAEANSSSNLLQMDVKKSSVADSVDVTFYTTADSTNSVVTRKSNNRYVVLLPNTSGSSSIVPSLGGVKDLISDIQVKNVDDGIGGYTKVTFETTKPVNIRTFMKKTAPLTQAQKDYKNLIAQNNKPVQQPQSQVKKADSAVSVTKPASVAAKTTAPQTQSKSQAKPVQSNNAQKTNTPAPKVVSMPKLTLTPVIPPKVKTEPVKAVSKNSAAVKDVQPKVQQTTSKQVEKHVSQPMDNYVPKMKFDENGKRQIDLEPRITHKIVEEKAVKTVKANSMFDIPQTKQSEQQASNVQEQTKTSAPVAEEKSGSQNHLPVWVFIAGGVGLILLAAFLVFDAVSHASEKDADRLKSFFDISSKNKARRRRREFQDIINDDNLSWQEKYKKYSEKDKQLHPVKKSEDMSYVTDMSASKKAIIAPQETVNRGFETDRRALRNNDYAQNLHSQSSNLQNNLNIEENIPATASMLNFKQAAGSINNVSDKEEKLKEQMRAKISQMEHSLAQTPNLEPPEEVSNEVRSEDNAIVGTFSEIKLKSFAKKPTLKESHRSLLDEDKKQSRNKSYKEGRFVKLKNSPLSVSRRKSTSSELEVSDLMGTGNKYLTNNNGEMKMDKQNENYLLSSLDEYLSILDSEDKSSMMTMEKSSVADTLGQMKSSSAMSRSGITNPIQRGSNPMSKQNHEPTHYMNGLIVKSGYNIDSEKGFYVVNLDGVSALVGRIKDNIFILKKFDYVVDKPLQVRLDYGSVYIVKVGGFKCLVDVAKEKMGTLIEI